MIVNCRDAIKQAVNELKLMSYDIMLSSSQREALRVAISALSPEVGLSEISWNIITKTISMSNEIADIQGYRSEDFVREKCAREFIPLIMNELSLRQTIDYAHYRLNVEAFLFVGRKKDKNDS